VSAAEPPASASPRPVQRIAAYALVTDPAGAVLLVRASHRSDLRGRWFLPGGGLGHGEHPRAGVLRELLEETGLRGATATVRTALSDVLDLPHRGVRLHTLRLVYDVRLDGDGTRAGAGLRSEPDGTSDLARFVPVDDVSSLPLMPFVAEVLGRPAPGPVPTSAPDRPEPLTPASIPEDVLPEEPVPGRDAERAVRIQRPAAYAVLVDDSGPGAERMLLTRLAGGEGLWTLPGGGIDFGEPPLAALRRELHEETGLPYTAGPLIEIGSRHFTGRAPSGRLEDFHGVRLIYAGSVPFDRRPQVVEVNGSTDLAAWVPVSQLAELGAVPTVLEALRIWGGRHESVRPRDGA
jgi:8-oxo-dGTP diphosphatase